MTTYYQERRPVRKIPTREQLAASRRQAILEARSRQQPSRHHIGSNAGFHHEEEEEILDVNKLQEEFETESTLSGSSVEESNEKCMLFGFEIGDTFKH